MSSRSSPPSRGLNGNKRLRVEDNQTVSPLKSEKSVSFAEDTKPPVDGDDKSDAKSSPKSKSKSKKKKKKAKSKHSTAKESSAAGASPEESFSLDPALSYLRQWDTARATSWKFNKNHQTLLIKYVFDHGRIPSADVATFYRYIRDLKGFIRTRLRQTAQEVIKRDMDDGQAAFPQPTQDKEGKQKEYEEVLSRLLKAPAREETGSSNADATTANANAIANATAASVSAGTVNANGKRTFDEVEFVLRTISPEVKQRVVKRMRAEAIADELSSDSGESTSSGETPAKTPSSSSSSSSSAARESAEAGTTEKRVKLNDGSQQKIKRRRLRNARTENVGSDESSSDDESGSDSDSSSSTSSSDDDDEDEEMALAPGLDAAETSSSSSSSSSESGSDSGSEASTEGDSDEESDESGAE